MGGGELGVSQVLEILQISLARTREKEQPAPGGRRDLRLSVAKQGGSHLAAVLILLLQQLGNRGHGDAGLEQGLSGCARKEEAGPPPGRLSGAAAAPPPPASLPDGGWRPPDSATIPAAPGAGQRHATCFPQSRPPPSPLPSILEPGKEATRGLPSLRATRTPAPQGRDGDTRSEPLSRGRRASRKGASHRRGDLWPGQSPRWRRAVTCARSRESGGARPGGAQASASGEEERVRRERRGACWGRLSLGKKRGTHKSTGPGRLVAPRAPRRGGGSGTDGTLQEAERPRKRSLP